MNQKEIDSLYLAEEENAENEKMSYNVPEDGPAGGSRRPSGGRDYRRLSGFLVGILLGVLICVVTVRIASFRSQARTADLDRNSKIEMILDYLDYYYLGELDDELIEDALARGLMENIGDPYALYYDADEFQNLMESMEGEFAGIGVQVAINDDGFVEIYKVYEDSPALEAGLQVKDLIVEAAGVRGFEDLDELVSLVRGEPGTTVDLVIERSGEEIPLTVERRYIQITSAYGMMLSDTVGYLQIAEFNRAAAEQFRTILDELLQEGMTSLIIDLRDNPGGDYDAVVDMCDRMIPEGPIVSVEDKLGGIHTENSDAQCLDLPVVLLVNENTASAAELFTMCMRDYGIAEIVGTTTFGKGIVQSIFQLPDGSGLKFTTEKYYGPKGDYIQDTGIEPDYFVEIPEEAYEDGRIYAEEDTQLQKALELFGLQVAYNEEEEEYEFLPLEQPE